MADTSGSIFMTSEKKSTEQTEIEGDEQDVAAKQSWAFKVDISCSTSQGQYPLVQSSPDTCKSETSEGNLHKPGRDFFGGGSDPYC
jgi:hypothetical protein